jgi:uncharacterized protein
MMYIRLQDLEIRKLEFREEFAPGAVDLGSEVRQIAPLKTSGRAEVVHEHHGGKEMVSDIRLVGKFSTRLEVNCARCLDPVAHEVAAEFDLLYRPLGADRRADEVSISEAETEIGYYDGEGMMLEDSLREQVLLALPLKTVCNESCKGMCPHCGRNLNQGECNCEPELKDSRWDALNEIKKRLQ